MHHQGGSTVFGPDDEVPDWAAKRITNPHVWADEPKSAAQAPKQQAEDPPKRSPGRPPKSEQQR